ARRPPAPGSHDEVHPEGGHAAGPARRRAHQAQARVHRADQPLARRGAPGHGGGPALRAAGRAAGMVQPADRQADLGRSSRGRTGRLTPAVAPACPRAVVPRLRRPATGGVVVRILLVGDYPPPYGGIAVHLQHLTRTLPQEGIACRVLNIGPNRRVPNPEYEAVRGPAEFLRRLIQYGRAGYLLHLFTNGENRKSWMLALLVGLTGRIMRTPTVVTITSGGAPGYLGSAGPWIRFIARWAIVLPAAVVCRTEA